MGAGKDKALIRDAACNWLNELTEHIVPGVQTKQERKAYKKQRDELSEAILRDAQRRRRGAAHAGPSKRAFWLEFHAPAVHTLAHDFDLTPRQIAKRLADLSQEDRRRGPHSIIETYRQRMEEINAEEQAEELMVRFDWIEHRTEQRTRVAVIPAKELIKWCEATGRDPRAFRAEELRWFLADRGSDEGQQYGEWLSEDYRFKDIVLTPQQFVTASVGE